VRGVLVLTTHRSGSTWLGSLTNSTAVLGKNDEWFAPKGVAGVHLVNRDFDKRLQEIIEKSSTSNGVFSIKIFPPHVHWYDQAYSVDILHRLMADHDVRLVRLERKDRIGQAISFARALRTKKWHSTREKVREEKYDFDLLCRSFFLIERSYDYWKSYLSLRGLAADELFYEDLVPDPKPFIKVFSDHAGLAEVPDFSSGLSILRDAKTDEWRQRFIEDIKRKNIVTPSSPSRPYRRSLGNLARFLSGRQMKPYPYAY
jgi:trehalose 2-sulfotransferase